MPLAATFALRALMSMLLHWEMEGGHRPANAKEKRQVRHPEGRQKRLTGKTFAKL